ncbi:peptide/nickel transport system substrate-binding protein [Klenkia marina]|uniref:Peptide/nickel transport system substrate-binding protein n=1 Tax=Klenkia marina TaxID=1960309 RepID=A0A1G4YV77_9ACTN|nr:ABC transporter substrate-binding protein [Klenkia marina]SCX57320.1 peptide/nickel transport system substrate-binding protein [Klenkia marina]
MRPHPHRLRAALALLLLVALLAGCSGGDPADTAVPTQSGARDGGLDGVRAPSDAAGGTLRLVTSQVDSLDPQRSYVPAVWNLMRLYTRTLVTYSSEPGSTDQLVPDLATDLGTTPDGGRTWTFTLRPGGTFETGRAITSRDLKYGIERSFAVDVVSGGPNFVLDLLDPDSLYAGPYQDESPDKLGLTTISTPDDATITFTLSRADPDFPYVLALPSSSPVPVENDTGAAYGADPVSSGPYAITSVDALTGIVLDRNTAWSPDSDPVRTALPDQVVVRTGLTGLDRDQALLAGSADADLTGNGVQEATLNRFADDPGLTDRVDDLATGSLRMLALPTTVGPMANPDCRAAVAAVVDRAAVQEELGGPDDALRRSVLWPSALPGGPEDTDAAADLDAARASLTSCGTPEGFAVTMAVPDVVGTRKVADALVGQLAQVGIVVTVQALDPATFYTAGVGSPAAIAAGPYAMVLATYAAVLPTPASFLVPLVDGRSISPEAGNANYALLDDPAVNAAVDTATAGGDPAAWAAVSTAALATHAFVPLVENRAQLLAGQRLRNGVVMLPYNGYDVATAGVGGG